MKVRPFSNGSEYTDWLCKNCDQCNISFENQNLKRGFICHIEEALANSYWEGEMDKTIADKIGFTDNFFNNCPFKNAYNLNPVKLNLTVFLQLRLF